MKIKINTGKRNKVIGEYSSSDNVYSKSVKGSVHLFKAINAWGIDADFFTDVLLPGNATIKIYDRESGITYFIDAKEFNAHAQYYHFNQHGEDDKAQIFCPRKHFAQMTI